MFKGQLSLQICDCKDGTKFLRRSVADCCLPPLPIALSLSVPDAPNDRTQSSSTLIAHPELIYSGVQGVNNQPHPVGAFLAFPFSLSIQAQAEAKSFAILQLQFGRAIEQSSGSNAYRESRRRPAAGGG